MLRAAILVVSVLCALPLAAETRVPGSAAEIRLSYAPVVAKAAPAVVNIYAQRVVERRASPFADDPFFSQFFGQMQTVPRVQNSLGSGVILDASGIVVSNYHVVGEATDIRVVLSDKREFDGTVMLADPEADLAVIRLAGAADLPALAFADSDAAEVGDLVLAIGNPFGVGQTVTGGIVSGLARTGAMQGGRGYFIQTDAPINPGNSGGALVDMTGRLIGINTSILTRSGGSNGIGFAIPANLVRQYVDQAKAGNRRLERPWAGLSVQTVDGPLAEALSMAVPQGVLVGALHPLSPYAAAGLETGDVITGFEGRAVDGGPELRYRMLTHGIGGTAEVAYLRDGRARRARVAMAPVPEIPPRDVTRIETRNVLNGLSVANINPAVIEEFGLPFAAEGVVIAGVEGPARRTRLRPGDVIRAVNGQRVTRAAEMARLARARVQGWEIVFERAGQRAIIRLANR